MIEVAELYVRRVHLPLLAALEQFWNAVLLEYPWNEAIVKAFSMNRTSLVVDCVERRVDVLIDMGYKWLAFIVARRISPLFYPWGTFSLWLTWVSQ
jgi:hypothetical protein